MIAITPQMHILLATEPVDFRKGIDGLIAICRNQLDQDPMSGTIFIFRSRSRNIIRLLTYDGQGFWLCAKHLSKGTFKWWPEDSINARQLQTLLWNGNPLLAKFSEDWKKISM